MLLKMHIIQMLILKMVNVVLKDFVLISESWVWKFQINTQQWSEMRETFRCSKEMNINFWLIQVCLWHALGPQGDPSTPQCNANSVRCGWRDLCTFKWANGSIISVLILNTRGEQPEEAWGHCALSLERIFTVLGGWVWCCLYHIYAECYVMIHGELVSYRYSYF